MLYLGACPKCKTGSFRLLAGWDGEYSRCLNYVGILGLTRAGASSKSGVSERPVMGPEEVAA